MKRFSLAGATDCRTKCHWMLGALVVGLCFFTSCSTVKVKTSPAEITEVALESADILEEAVPAALQVFDSFGEETAELLRKAKRYEFQRKDLEAAGAYLKVAADAHVRLVSGQETSGSEGEKALVEIYNNALASFASRWMEDHRRFESGSCQYTCGHEQIEITLSSDSPYGADYFDYFIASGALQKKGIVSKTRAGSGAALVGIRERSPDRAEELRFFPGRGLHVPVTLTIDSVSVAQGDLKKVTFSLRNPLLQDRVALGNRTMPLAADFSAPLAVVLRGGNEVLSGIHGFFKADQRIDDSGFLLLEPYDPDRIPVILIHGLFSVPMIWRDIVPEMTCVPEISRRYQFILFTYPSSFPVVESSELLRDQLAALRAVYDPDGNDPLSRNLVLAGHSMGGILSRSLVTEFGDNLWKQYSDLPIESLDITEAERAKMRKLTYFPPDPGVSRVIFFATPHRGSNLARKGIAGAISRTARLPGSVVQFSSNFLEPRIESAAAVPTKEKVTSVQSLQPGSPMLSAMEVSPYKAGVRYHSVIGDRGRGDTPDSSDGIVEYWSSRQDGADSELIVPSDHKSYRHPEGIAEMRRILLEHVGL